MKILSKNAVEVTLKDQGGNCWTGNRFILSDRCMSVFTCSYPEKRTCQAVQAEIAHLRDTQIRMVRSITQIGHTIESLRQMTEE